MSINAKHLATFILGAAAGVAAHKYLQSEEGEKLLEDLKTKANNLKAEAEGAMDKAPEYFEELKTKGADTLKSSFPDAENFFKELYDKFVGSKGGAETATPANTPTPDPIS
ncbi:YtxH domain-containing protein [Dyadobacter chenwenxiniae]|uniref:YtxH domain-containing protein n=1 Tax=Dyadobacter chenwenxiniae TaxID=2906456 RepID=A0A9X1PIR7_9BACT|nr:YtxH domain-containing protein [Dyadobacter chenwenxiniae]MCF0049661.1 YtxH domain-containing protein [Dyadobacter chenwenxiniae]MCF0062087.1 YtxH domain-containing protein [Dyadobacter chenwenxiniae]UON81892.1 YtxH domain-containing protein [Dyadobacter chenwenxiniae]